MRVGHTGHDASRQQTSQVQRLRLDDIHDFMFQQLGELLFGGQAFASCHRHRAAPGHLDHGRDIGMWHWLFEPGRPELVDGF